MCVCVWVAPSKRWRPMPLALATAIGPRVQVPSYPRVSLRFFFPVSSRYTHTRVMRKPQAGVTVPPHHDASLMLRAVDSECPSTRGAQVGEPLAVYLRLLLPSSSAQPTPRCRPTFGSAERQAWRPMPPRQSAGSPVSPSTTTATTHSLEQFESLSQDSQRTSTESLHTLHHPNLLCALQSLTRGCSELT